ncbi:MAG: adenylyl-sulfate kinase [Myxococcales bacterium]|nr:adenylyl-sulfate kinase [Myxococcales bacterium]
MTEIVDRVTRAPVALAARAANLPRITLDARELADLELIATGAARPLTGFVGKADYHSILTTSRLANGAVWSIPLTLALGDDVLSSASPGAELSLYDAAGRLRGILTVKDVFERDTARELDVVYGTHDPAHPGVAYLVSRPRKLVGGDVEVLAFRPLGEREPKNRATDGFILWFTGMSGAGKSTLSAAVASQLDGERRIEVLDGDEVRTHLSKGLGFSREDRDTNVHRIAFVARTLAAHGVGVITAAISPYAETRRAVRALAEERGLAFIEVHAHSSLEALVARDVKGLYEKALAGEVTHFTGVSDPYEAPESPDVRVHTDVETIEQSTAKIIEALRARGLVRSPVRTATTNGVRPHAGA